MKQLQKQPQKQSLINQKQLKPLKQLVVSVFPFPETIFSIYETILETTRINTETTIQNKKFSNFVLISPTRGFIKDAILRYYRYYSVQFYMLLLNPPVSILIRRLKFNYFHLKYHLNFLNCFQLFHDCQTKRCYFSYNPNSLFGHQVGDGNVYLSKKYVKVGLTLMYSSVLIMAILTITFRDLIASFYINDYEVQQVISNIITIFSIYTAASLTNCCIGFMLRILLEEKFVLRWYLICYYGISLSCAYILCFHFGLSYIGIWGGMGIGLHIMSGILIIKILKIDWEKKVNYVSTMMKKKENANEDVNIELVEVKKEEGFDSIQDNQ